MPDQHTVLGPYVQVACLCHTAIQEADGTVSVIKIIDRVQIMGTSPQMQPQPLSQYSLVLILKSGTLRESHQIKIVPITPSGTSLGAAETTSLFEGDERGVVIITPLALVVTEQGLYWFDIYLEDQLLTRIPLRVLYNRIQLPPGLQPPTA